MNFKKAGIFRRSSEGSEQPEVQNDSGGMLAVWGSPGSGKTVTAVKIAKMLSAKKKNVILLLCDMTAPMLPCICSPDELECERSLGNILAAARIGENLIKHNLVTLKRSNYLTVLGLLKGENEYSIPPFTEKQAIELLDGLRQIAPYAMDIKSFKPRQTVYIVGDARRPRDKFSAVKAEVAKVGRKYVTISGRCGERFREAHNRDMPYLIEETEYGSPRLLFPSEDAVREYQEREELKEWVRVAAGWDKIGRYTLEQLRAVKKILEG